MLGSRKCSGIVVSGFCHWSMDKWRRNECDTPAASADLSQEPRGYLLWKGAPWLNPALGVLVLHWGMQWLRFHQLHATAPELLGKWPWFWGCQCVKNGGVKSSSCLSVTAFTPGKTGEHLPSNNPVPFLYHDGEVQSDPGFWGVVEHLSITPPVHTGSSKGQVVQRFGEAAGACHWKPVEAACLLMQLWRKTGLTISYFRKSRALCKLHKLLAKDFKQWMHLFSNYLWTGRKQTSQ